MTTFRLSFAAVLATATLAVASAPAMAQGSDRMPGGVERSPEIDMGRSRGLTPSTKPPPAPIQALPAPAAEPPKPTETEAKPKTGKKSSKGPAGGSAPETPARERSITPGGDDKRVGGVERSPAAPGSQP